MGGTNGNCKVSFLCQRQGRHNLVCLPLKAASVNNARHNRGVCARHRMNLDSRLESLKPFSVGLIDAAHPVHSVQSLLCSPEAAGSHWEAAIGDLAGRVFLSHSDLAAAVLQALSQMYDQWHLDGSPAAGLLAAGDAPASDEAGGDGAGKPLCCHVLIILGGCTCRRV